MAVDIETLKILYFQNDEPCPYKLKSGYELYIYPVSVKNWGVFEHSLSILQIDKNKINDINIIQMSYLEYLYLLYSQNEEYGMYIANVFKYSLREERISFVQSNGRTLLVILDENDTIKGYINHKEFDEIKKIILHQNIYDYKDIYIDADVQQLYEDYYRMKYKNSKTPTLEEQKTYVISKCGYSMQQINDLSYRVFSQVYNHCVGDIIYLGRKIIQGSYKYEVKEDIQHPLYELPKDRFSEIFEDTSVLSDKGINGAEQLNALNIAEEINNKQ